VGAVLHSAQHITGHSEDGHSMWSLALVLTTNINSWIKQTRKYLNYINNPHTDKHKNTKQKILSQRVTHTHNLMIAMNNEIAGLVAFYYVIWPGHGTGLFDISRNPH